MSAANDNEGKSRRVPTPPASPLGREPPSASGRLVEQVPELVKARVSPELFPLEAESPSRITLPWPSNVPGNDLAEEHLRMPAESGKWAAMTTALLKALTDAERGVLMEPALPAHLIGLRTAVLFRWRLAAMLATAPRSLEVPMDHRALEAVLVESDDVLMALRMPEGVDPEAQAGFNSARASVARDVVTLAGITQKLQPPSAAVLAEHDARVSRVKAAAQSRAAATARKVTFEPVKVVAPRRIPKLYVAGAAVLLLGAGYHLVRYLEQPGPEPVKAVFADIPEGALGSNDLKHGVLTFQVIPGRTLRREQLEALRAKAVSQGKVFEEIAPGFFFIGPESERPRTEHKT